MKSLFSCAQAAVQKKSPGLRLVKRKTFCLSHLPFRSYFCQQIRHLSQAFKPKTIMLVEFVFAPDYNADMTVDEQRHDVKRSLWFQKYVRDILKSRG